jgi:hypothetical protein
MDVHQDCLQRTVRRTHMVRLKDFPGVLARLVAVDAIVKKS